MVFTKECSDNHTPLELSPGPARLLRNRMEHYNVAEREAALIRRLKSFSRGADVISVTVAPVENMHAGHKRRSAANNQTGRMSTAAALSVHATCNARHRGSLVLSLRIHTHRFLSTSCHLPPIRDRWPTGYQIRYNMTRVSRVFAGPMGHDVWSMFAPCQPPSAAQILLIFHSFCHATPRRVAMPPSILRELRHHPYPLHPEGAFGHIRAQ